MWSLHHDDNRSYRGGPALFWEMYERNPESGTVLQILTDALDGGKVLYRSIAPTNFASLYKNRRATYWKSAEFMMRRLADLHREGWAALQPLDTYSEPNTYARGIYRRPTNRQMVRFLAQTYGYRLQQKVLGSARGAVGDRVPAPWLGRSVHDRGPAGGPLLRRSVPGRA